LFFLPFVIKPLYYSKILFSTSSVILKSPLSVTLNIIPDAELELKLKLSDSLSELELNDDELLLDDILLEELELELDDNELDDNELELELNELLLEELELLRLPGHVQLPLFTKKLSNAPLTGGVPV
jgi:hypothetical protein